MGAIDVLSKKYMNRNDVFAEVFNQFMFEGEPFIRPDTLHTLSSSEIRTQPEIKEKQRDVLKQAIIKEDEDSVYALILGVENQSYINYAMPVRVLNYNAIQYENQIDEESKNQKKASQEGKLELNGDEFLSVKKGTKLKPVYTLVIYFGLKKWDGPLSLHEMLDIPKEKVRFFDDYRVNLLSPLTMSMEEICKFDTDFREIAMMIHCGNDKKKLEEIIQSNPRFKEMDPTTAELANQLTKAELNFEGQEGKFDMCLAIEQMREESVKKGIKEEQERGILKMVKVLKEASIPFELCFSIVANAYKEVEAIFIQKTIDQVYSS